MFYTTDREAGNKIEAFDTPEEAKKAIIAYEKEDKHNGIYEENFYSVVDDDFCIVDWGGNNNDWISIFWNFIFWLYAFAYSFCVYSWIFRKAQKATQGAGASAMAT